jgi:cell division protein FtsZ
MASPLLEAGAIDGARGILINITGSSSLKLSEVNEASTLIQSAAHEDANIIFGAVQDEKMGEEIKITVIATGFRDQMPERRARMLSVEETPVVSVPVVAPDTWMREPAEAPAVPAPAPARFLSEDEESEQGSAEADEAAFFSASAPAANNNVAQAQAAETGIETELVAEPARPQFAEMVEEPAYTPLPRDYASDFGNGLRGPAGAEESQPVARSFSEPGEAAERDLDVPAFMRRLQF